MDWIIVGLLVLICLILIWGVWELADAHRSRIIRDQTQLLIAIEKHLHGISHIVTQIETNITKELLRRDGPTA